MPMDKDTLGQLLETIRRFVDERLIPAEAEVAETDAIPERLVAEMRDLGLFGLTAPEAFGGLGLTMEEEVLAVFELGRAAPAFRSMFATNVGIGMQGIAIDGTPEQKAKYLKPLAEGTKLGAFGLTEPNAGTDALNGSTVATKNEDGSYTLNGSKVFNTNGGEADVTVVFASTDKSKGAKGMSAFILEKGMEGFTYGKKEVKMGIRASVQRELVFQNVKVPAENLLGKEGEGFKIAMMTLDGGRVGVGAQALGIAEGAYNAAVQYAKERTQFGKPIAKFQAISFMLADMKLKIETARLAVYKAAWKMAQPDVKSYSVDAAIAKKYASDVAMQVTTDAVQVFGGYGFTREYPVERYMRDAKITQIYEGTNEVQLMVTGGALLR